MIYASSIELTAGQYAGFVDPDLFGANFIVSKDSLGGTYQDKVDQLDVTHIRFPGGEVTELYFDLLNPDNMPISEAGTVDGISQYIAFANERGLKLQIVVPTKRYATDPQQGVADLEVFIERLEAGDYGEVGEYTIEIGNEYYAKQSEYSDETFSAAIYGEIAGLFSSAIEGGSDGRASIAVQIGRKAAENDAIIDNFAINAGSATVDYLVAHAYAWSESGVEGKLQDVADAAAVWSRIGVVAPVYLSEWNIGSSSDTSNDDRRDYGLAQTSALVEYVEQMAVQGFEMASIWGVQQRNKTSLFSGEGSDNVADYAGYAFKMLLDRVSGSYVLQSSVDLGDGGAVISSWAFDKSESTSVFFSKDEGAEEVEITFDQSSLYVDFEAFMMEGITTASDPEKHNGLAVHWTSDYSVIQLGADDVSIEFEVAHEFKVIDLIKVGVTWSSVEGFDGSARLTNLEVGSGDAVVETFFDEVDEFIWVTATRDRIGDTVNEVKFEFADGVEIIDYVSAVRSVNVYLDQDNAHSWDQMAVSDDLVELIFDDGSMLELYGSYGGFTNATLDLDSSSTVGGAHVSLNLVREMGFTFSASISNGVFALGSVADSGGLSSAMLFDRNDEFEWDDLAVEAVDDEWSPVLESDNQYEFAASISEMQNAFDELTAAIDIASDVFDFYLF